MTMTRGEREDLLKLIRQRERVLKSGATQRAAEMLADFEKKVSAIYDFNKDDVWKAAVEEVKKVVEEAKEKIADRCKALGIPEEFAPDISFGWYGRGENAVKSRREELRRAAKAEIDAMEQAARTEIERMSVEAQTQIIAHGLSSDAAKSFLAQLPTVEKLMPALKVAEIEHKNAEKRGRLN